MLKTLLTLQVLSTRGFVRRGLATNPLWGLEHEFLSQAPALHLLKGEALKGQPSPRGQAKKVKSFSPVPSRGPRARCSPSGCLLPGLLGFTTSLSLG